MDDLISRRAAIDAVGFYSLHSGDKLLFADKPLRDLPSAQPEPKWIPCSERLPEELQEVNITWVNTNPESYYESIKGKPFTGSAVYYKGRWNWYSSVCRDYLAEYGFSPNDEVDDAIKVIAWMPLPKPWRGEANERNN